VDGGGAIGYGECVAEQDPYYSAETNETAWHIITAFIAPRVVGVEFAHPRDVFPALKAIRGHNMAKAAVEMAAWDLFARQQNVPLCRVLGGTRERIASGVSIGIQDSLAALAEHVERELAAADHAVLQRRIATPICLDESIKTVHAAEEAIAAGACRIVNIKPGRLGGFREAIRLHDLCASLGIPVWHGGMLESGIGRAANIHL